MTGQVSTALRLLALVLLLGLAWLLRDVVMLLFGAVLFAAALRALARPVTRLGRLPYKPVFAAVVVGLLLTTGVAVWLLGGPLAEQLQALRTAVPEAWQALQQWLAMRPLGARLLDLTSQWGADDLPWMSIAGLAGQLMRGIGTLGLILLLGVYLAFDVYLYRNGLLRLFPPSRREQVGGALDAAGNALTRWLLGQLVTMLVIGTAVSLGLAVLGMPLALALGLVAGLLNFVPFFGPIASGLLAVLVAFVQGPQQALYVALLFVGVQQLEGNVLVPLVQRWAVHMPPALAVLSVLVFGVLFGLFGVMFGTPLMVVTMVLVQRLYVEQTLEHRTPSPRGET